MAHKFCSKPVPNSVVQIYTLVSDTLTILITYITPARFYSHVKASHWVCTIDIGAKWGEVLLMDSLASLINETLILQVTQIYEIPVKISCLIIRTLDVQQQNGCKDCGVFSIAFAAELCSGNDPRKYISSK